MNEPPKGDLVVLAGSRGYGTQVATSDWDYRGFYMPERRHILGYRAPKDSKVEQDETQDNALWEIRHFFRMAVQANPNVLETLFVPKENVQSVSEYGQDVLAARDMFLSKRIGRTYLGYATGNAKRIVTQKDVAAERRKYTSKPVPDYDAKDAMHLIRLVRTGMEFLRTGNFRVYRPEDRGYFIGIRDGEIELHHILEEFEEAKAAWPALEKSCPAPEVPNEGDLDQLCMSIMGQYVRDRGW